jgi:hypothetical protein
MGRAPTNTTKSGWAIRAWICWSIRAHTPRAPCRREEIWWCTSESFAGSEVWTSARWVCPAWWHLSAWMPWRDWRVICHGSTVESPALRAQSTGKRRLAYPTSVCPRRRHSPFRSKFCRWPSPIATARCCRWKCWPLLFSAITQSYFCFLIEWTSSIVAWVGSEAIPARSETLPRTRLPGLWRIAWRRCLAPKTAR